VRAVWQGVRSHRDHTGIVVNTDSHFAEDHVPTYCCAERKLSHFQSARQLWLQRHSTQSNFRADSDLNFVDCGTIVPEPPVPK
jgi:hypothetical protein